ncbi:MAG: LysR family transcriptional regulator [Burkholderiales bacterium]|nr:LysR family transcriptional regulator [Burkholderiales bacterium]MDE2396121.1 LysR family transcriptional regulator [Burkholderiales bacterium]MDE2457450.1 LysR family transcriptional regulator [Burkholderiales bacterium]
MMIHRAASLELPSLRALQAFEAVAQCGSVTEAALQLGVSPGAVSQQLRKLEAALAVRLLERSGNGMALTSWGQLYHAELGPAFAQLRSAQEKLWRARTQGALVLSCLSSVASRWIGPRLFDWKTSHPGAKLRLLGAEAEPRPGDEAVDFRITYGRAASGFAHQAELFTDRVVPACAPELLEAHRLRKPADLLELPLIGIEWEPGHGAPPSWMEWAASIGAQRSWPASELSFSLSSAAIDAAVNGRGVVMAQVSLIADDLASGRLVVPFDRRLALAEPYFLAWDRAALQKPFGAEFRAWVIALARRQAELATAALPTPARGAAATSPPKPAAPARGSRAPP